MLVEAEFSLGCAAQFTQRLCCFILHELGPVI